MIAAICFGAIFGFPFIAWGVILICDRERTWQRKQGLAKAGETPQRRPNWDRRQIVYGILLIAIGTTVFLLLAIFNVWAQGISPPSPF